MSSWVWPAPVRAVPCRRTGRACRASWPAAHGFTIVLAPACDFAQPRAIGTRNRLPSSPHAQGTAVGLGPQAAVGAKPARPAGMVASGQKRPRPLVSGLARPGTLRRHRPVANRLHARSSGGFVFRLVMPRKLAAAFAGIRPYASAWPPPLGRRSGSLSTTDACGRKRPPSGVRRPQREPVCSESLNALEIVGRRRVHA